jgi:hypothetical protein
MDRMGAQRPLPLPRVTHAQCVQKIRTIRALLAVSYANGARPLGELPQYLKRSTLDINVLDTDRNGVIRDRMKPAGRSLRHHNDRTTIPNAQPPS